MQSFIVAAFGGVSFQNRLIASYLAILNRKITQSTAQVHRRAKGLKKKGKKSRAPDGFVHRNLFTQVFLKPFVNIVGLLDWKAG